MQHAIPMLCVQTSKEVTIARAILDFQEMGLRCALVRCRIPPFIFFAYNLVIPTDIDECNSGDAVCWSHSTCQNTIGSYNCQCDSGYQFQSDGCYGMCLDFPCIVGAKFSRIDIDECQTSSFDCPAHSTCNNIDGGYSCNCNTGFRDDDNDNCAGTYSPFFVIFGANLNDRCERVYRVNAQLRCEFHLQEY